VNATVVAASAGQLTLQVRQIRFEGVGINSYELVDPVGRDLPAFEAGAHIDVHLAPGIIRQYSLCNDPAERHRYVIGVLRDEKGRGGSKALHERLQVQQLVKVSAPRNNFPLAPSKKAILIAGGIGVTPIKSMAHALERSGTEYELHYCARDWAHAAFREELAGLRANRVQFHFDNGNPADGLDIANLLRVAEDDVHVYYCGPAGFMKACATASAHWQTGTVHSEHFKAPEPTVVATADDSAGSFTIKMRSSDETVTVRPDQSIVDALAGVGVTIETSCQSGLCGTCKVGYVSGDVDHRDCILGADEQSEFLTACVSRGRGCLVLDV
jgi:vanillate O-demethylase ferredoxin subunit